MLLRSCYTLNPYCSTHPPMSFIIKYASHHAYYIDNQLHYGRRIIDTKNKPCIYNFTHQNRGKFT